MWYHVSPVRDLHKNGIRAGARPTVSRYPSPYIYLGTLDYIFEQYFSYAPRGNYYLYEVNTEELKLETNLPPGQVRVLGNIPQEKVKLVKQIRN